ncbi:serine hydrolase domain-containing protein [Bernardetia sp. ABR2-2B]|uniref:serine hydrolase domain-containing protein n=1 Tax=Bernardetia sp. ABR2-2B TaxID=3127472 RepID=UPI0030CFE53E
MKKTNLFTLITCLTFAFFSCTTDEETITPITSKEELTTYLQEVYEESELPAFSLAIVKNGEITYQNSFGYQNIESSNLYTNNTLQPIASISKTILGVATVKAIELGYFDLDTDINTILPNPITNPNNPNDIIKVRHLVTHTSSLLDVSEAYVDVYYIQNGENINTEGAALLQSYMGIEQRNKKSLESLISNYFYPSGSNYSLEIFSTSKAGEKWEYSNVASSLMAYLIEIKANQPYHQFVEEQVFEPLEMNESTYFPSLSNDKLATLYFDKNTPLPKYGNDSYPDGSVFTSNEELSLFLLAMIKGYHFSEPSVISSEGFERLFAPLLASEKLILQAHDNHGVFWVHDKNILQHSGSDPGTTCLLEFSKEKPEGFLLLTNSDASVEETQLVYNQTAQKIKQAIASFLDSGH